MWFTTPALLLAAVPFASAAVMVTKPAAGESVAGSTILSITVGDDGAQPPIAAIGAVTVTLLAGGNTDADVMTVATTAVQPFSGALIALPLDPLKGPGGVNNAYYLKIQQTATTGGQTATTYSKRFSLTGMTGTWSSQAIQAAAVQAGADPANVPKGTTGGAAANGGASASGAFASGNGIGDPHPTGTWPAFSLQTVGATKFAPMQGRPNKKMTQTNTAPLYPTSSWSIFHTNAPIPTWKTTATASQTYKVVSRENTNSPEAKPTGKNADMEKWLARWKD